MNAGRTWTVADAEACMSEMLEQARTAMQVITRDGVPIAFVLPARDWAHWSERRGSLSQFFADSPLRNSDIDLDRSPDGPRDYAID